MMTCSFGRNHRVVSASVSLYSVWANAPARSLLKSVLQRDPNHALAADLSRTFKDETFNQQLSDNAGLGDGAPNWKQRSVTQSAK